MGTGYIVHYTTSLTLALSSYFLLGFPIDNSTNYWKLLKCYNSKLINMNRNFHTSEGGSVVNTARGTAVAGWRDPMANFGFWTFKLFPQNFLDMGDFRACAATWWTLLAWNNVLAGIPEEFILLWSKLWLSKLWPTELLIFVDTLLNSEETKESIRRRRN